MGPHKLGILIAIAPLLIGAALVFDASARASHAVEIAQSVERAETPELRAAILERAEREFGGPLSMASTWHAGAAEANSALAMLTAAASEDQAKLRLSAQWAGHAVRLSPVMPIAWARLAVLREAGWDAGLCDTRGCLEQSWRMGPMLGGEAGCARIQLAYRRGWLGADDARIMQYAHAGDGAVEVATCLQFLGPDVVFRALLAQRR